MLVEAFVGQSAVEALDEAVLHGLAWRDVVPFALSVLLPRQDRVRGQFGAVACREGSAVEVVAACAAPKLA